MIPRSTATIGSILKYNGYSTSWFGKDHNTPDWESSVAGPYDRWPTGMGFDHFYGFIGGETHQYHPILFEKTSPVEPNKTPEQGYHFMTDMTDKAIQWLRYNKSVAPQKPVLLYFAPGAAHAPHQAPKEWRDKFKGQFDAGWDAVREATCQRQLQMGIVPPGTKLTARPNQPSASAPIRGSRLDEACYNNIRCHAPRSDRHGFKIVSAPIAIRWQKVS